MMFVHVCKMGQVRVILFVRKLLNHLCVSGRRSPRRIFEYNGSLARIICVAVATLANEKLLERASDNDLLLCRKSTSNKTRYRQ